MSKTRLNVKDSKLEKQEILQAVILANDFTTNLTPMQQVFPSILTPVTNVPLLDYLIVTLIQSGIQEVFIYCSNHIDILKNYVAAKQYKDLSVSLIISDGCRSLGDALRDIDTKGWIRGDFILIRGDAFINANLTALMTKHRAKREKDKGAAMTLVLRDVGSGKKSLLDRETCLFVADKLNDKVLFYKKPTKDEKKIKFELEWFLDHEQIDINNGFVDTHVYMCSPSVLPLFADNFDFQTMEDFIRGVLINEEILDARIYWQSLNCEEYALPITSWLAYHTLSRDVLQRQGDPLTPDILCPLRGIVYTSRSIYKNQSATLARGCILQKDSLIGSKSILGKNTSVNRSVIGDDCIIGDNVVIENSYIFTNVKIDDDCVIQNAVLFSNCVLNKNIQLDICIVSPGVDLPGEGRYVNCILEKKNGKLITKDMGECGDDYDEIVYFKQTCSNNDNDDDNSYSSGKSSIEMSSDAESELPDDTHIFLSEVIDSLLRGYQDQLNCENLILEINSSRYAYNVGIREVTYNVVKAILMLPLHYLNENKTNVDNVNYQKTLKIMIQYFNPIIVNYIKTEDAQEDCLKAIEDTAETVHQLVNFAQHLIHLFYEKDILSEENILSWYNQDSSDSEIYNKELRNALQPFIKWLNEAEESSSSDD